MVTGKKPYQLGKSSSTVFSVIIKELTAVATIQIFALFASWHHACVRESCIQKLTGLVIIIIIITLQTANPNWESLTPKTQRPQQGRQPSKERENDRTNIKTKTNNNKNKYKSNKNKQQ